MLPDNAKNEILGLAREDWTPLFDVTSVVKSCFVHGTLDEQIEVARAFVRHLLSRGYVKLYYDCWVTSTSSRRNAKELTIDEVKREINDRANWLYHERRQPDERWVTIGATPAGVDADDRCEFPAS